MFQLKYLCKENLFYNKPLLLVLRAREIVAFFSNVPIHIIGTTQYLKKGKRKFSISSQIV